MIRVLVADDHAVVRRGIPPNPRRNEGQRRRASIDRRRAVVEALEGRFHAVILDVTCPAAAVSSFSPISNAKSPRLPR